MCMDCFAQTLATMNLQEISFQGYLYTWHRGWANEGGVEERMDRAFGTENWLFKYVGALLTHLPFRSSDHCWILLRLYYPYNNGHFIYYSHFENWWFMVDGFMNASSSTIQG